MRGRMKVSTDCDGRESVIVDLFRETFTASEGAAEGASIGALVRDLLVGTAPEDIHVFIAEAEDPIPAAAPAAIPAAIPAAAAIFTRLSYPQDERMVFLLSPLAVATARQGRGIGQELLVQALEALRTDGVDVVMTYGDPAFYGKVGFALISQDIARPPLPLSQPEGWLGYWLGAGGSAPLVGRSTCVRALRDPHHW